MKSRSERERARDRNILISLLILLAIAYVVKSGSAIVIGGGKIEATTEQDPYVRYITIADPSADNSQIIEVKIYGEGIAVDKDYWELIPGGTISMLAYITPPAQGWIVIEGSDKENRGSVAYRVRVLVPVCVNAPCPIQPPEIEPQKPAPQTTAPLVSPTQIHTSVPEVESTESPVQPRTATEAPIPYLALGIGIVCVILAALFAYRAGIRKGLR